MKEAIIYEKVGVIHADLLQQTPDTCMDKESREPFKASQGWSENFQKQISICYLVGQGEAVSANMKAAENYFETFVGIIVT